MAINVAENITVIESQIEDRLIEYFQQRNIDITDLYTAYGIKQNTYNAMWKYCYNCLFKPMVKQPDNRNSTIDYNDIGQLNAICDAYLDVCFEYHIEPTFFGFCRLTGISRETIDRWQNNESRGKASFRWYDITKKIRDASQNYTRSELENTPVGQITKANNDEEKGLLYSRQQAQSLLFAAQLESPEQIAAKYGSVERPMIAENAENVQ